MWWNWRPELGGFKKQSNIDKFFKNFIFICLWETEDREGENKQQALFVGEKLRTQLTDTLVGFNWNNGSFSREKKVYEWFTNFFVCVLWFELCNIYRIIMPDWPSSLGVSEKSTSSVNFLTKLFKQMFVLLEIETANCSISKLCTNSIVSNL